ncbi:VOC family protein [Kangiella aquimarina]|uniref:VOC family protein n=1 Tax=Kangiella aquimarina TaxID=261965 RepID=A0ABZ0X7C7_9GAMM|nr:VOC family protein [Kangiella aquimarina]WQG86506.1 VOC family protein [Kangiella aquimarina]
MQSNCQKITNVIVVKNLEKGIKFWEKVGFEVVTSVPQGDEIGFVILSNGKTEIMFQTTASIEEDISQVLPESKTFLFVEVEDIVEIQKMLEGENILIEERETFYGATETICTDPYGNWICFAQFKEGKPE